MFKQYVQPTIYTFFALLYLCVGDVFHSNQLYTLPIHGIYLVLTLYYVYRCFSDCRMNRAIKATAILYFLHLLYGLFFYIVGFGTMARGVDPSVFINTYFNSMSAIFVFYYFSEKGYVDNRWFVWAVVIFAVVVFFQHQFYQIRASIELMADIGDFTSNSGYYFLAVLPATVFLIKKPMLMYAMIIYISVMVLTCAKRGAVICCAVVVVYLLYQMNRTYKHKFWIIVLSIALIIGMSYFIQDLLENSLLFARRVDELKEGNSSDRDIIYTKIWNYFINNNSVMGFLIGNGPYAPSRLVGMMAHNDWLEISLSMGVLGIVIYIRYWYAQIRLWIDVKSAGVDYAVVLAMASFIIINLMKTFFSMSLDDMMIYTTSVMGFCFSQCNEWNINKEIQQV